MKLVVTLAVSAAILLTSSASIANTGGGVIIKSQGSGGGVILKSKGSGGIVITPSNSGGGVIINKK
ncbi:hypothetical protein CJF42_05095 [Pseudoalteromonas sp. NBT06-2]|uniref:hypothetical protein n=1 Tax=Pseudoalteromonas sp. NBT06-2 TaxID=2025950 RepID=UPI000BA50438|nr:hypothetical protein [Pseudoalteromonas sp. NBT06-2]PAJ75515.1 hypothetical protein CJF42_05095 [Pseudoalteromonas sp. NBT06-2]